MNIGILTGGGDCPGMNAFIRSVTRSALNLIPDVHVWGILDGWRGLIEKSYRTLTALDTAGISSLGGTILGTVRVPEMRTDHKLRQIVHAEALQEISVELRLERRHRQVPAVAGRVHVVVMRGAAKEM